MKRHELSGPEVQETQSVRGAILCGGRSRRMGRPKALLPWNGATLLEHARDRLLSAGLEPVLLGPADWAGTYGLRWIPDAVEDAGPLGGVLAALALGDVFALAVDVPLLEVDEIAALVREGTISGAATIPGSAGSIHPLSAFWPADLLGPLGRYVEAGGRSAHGFLSGVPHRLLGDADLLRLGVDPRHFANVNTPAEYEVARIAAGQVGAEEERP